MTIIINNPAWRFQPPPDAPVITNFVATPTAINSGGSSVLSATVTGVVTSLTLDGAPVTLPITVSPSGTHLYTLIATGPGGSTSATTTVTVNVGTVQPWFARPLPASNGSIVLAPLGAFQWSLTDPTSINPAFNAGAKHSMVVYNPNNGLLYIFGGDTGGYYANANDQAGGYTSNDGNSAVWTYNVATDTFAAVLGWDPGAGNITPHDPDVGMWGWDSTRSRFWFHRGYSMIPVVQGAGILANQVAIGTATLTWSYLGGRIMPDTYVIPASTIALVDNANNYLEYNLSTHTVTNNQTGFTNSKAAVDANPNQNWTVLPLYQVVTSAGVVTSVLNNRPDFIDWGNSTTDNLDPRRYGKMYSLLQFDPTTVKWTDPALMTVEATFPSNGSTKSLSRQFISYYQIRNLHYDPVKDQLVEVGGTWSDGGLVNALHYDFLSNTWSRYPLQAPYSTYSWNIASNNSVINPADRCVYYLEPYSQNSSPYGGRQVATAWSYDLDAHTFAIVTASIPGIQQGLANGFTYPSGSELAPGTPCGVGLDYGRLFFDSGNSIIWWAETENPDLNPYTYAAAARIVHMHAWHFQENRWETIDPAYDATNRPHINIGGFDPVANRIVGWGQNASVVPNGTTSSYPPGTIDPVMLKPYVYVWQPSGFTLPTWQAVA